MDTIKRAGDVVGTPDWQLDIMFENESARLWEHLNRPDPEEDRMKKAAVDLRAACEFLTFASDRMADAMNVLHDTPMADRVKSFLQNQEEMTIDLYDLCEKYERGNRN